MKQYVAILLMLACVGCGDGRREHRRRNIDDDLGPPTPIVNPHRVSTLADAQRGQVKARATCFRELAEQNRKGLVKTAYQLHDGFVQYEKMSAADFERLLGTTLAECFSQKNTDDLPANAAKLLDELADELEGILK